MAIPSVVIAEAGRIAGTIGESILGKLFGIKPRGDFQKFSRTIYPLMAAQAKLAALPVYAYWFGDIVEVRPDGTWGVYQHAGTLDAAVSLWRQMEAQGANFLVLRVPAGVDFDDYRQLASSASFEEFGRPGILDRITDIFKPQPTAPPTTPADQATPIKAAVPLIAGILIVGLIFAGRK